MIYLYWGLASCARREVREIQISQKCLVSWIRKERYDKKISVDNRNQSIKHLKDQKEEEEKEHQ